MYTSGMPKGPEEPQRRLPSLDFAACAEHCIGAGQLQGKPRDLGLAGFHRVASNLQRV